ncbi:MAG: DUF126 domain-containing protein [Anaerolineales bacterium]
MVIKGKPIIPGEASGRAIVSRQPISFWGGVDPSSGEVIDRRHDCAGKVIKGKIFVFPTGKGSSTGSAVLMESIRNGNAPAAIINLKLEPILALGAIVAEEIYHKTVPMLIISEADFEKIKEGDLLTIDMEGKIKVS